MNVDQSPLVFTREDLAPADSQDSQSVRTDHQRGPSTRLCLFSLALASPPMTRQLVGFLSMCSTRLDCVTAGEIGDTSPAVPRAGGSKYLSSVHFHTHVPPLPHVISLTPPSPHGFRGAERLSSLAAEENIMPEVTMGLLTL